MISKSLKRIAFGLLITILVVLAFATVIEKLNGTEFVSTNIYGSWWFVVLWIAFGISSFAYIIVRSAYKQKPSFCLHCSLGIILIGALVTYLTAERGYIHLRQGKPLNEYVTEDGMTKKALPFEVKLVLFEIEYHGESDKPSDFMSFLRVDGEMCKVSMNKIYTKDNYRLYQLSYDSDEMGTVLLVNHDPWGIGITYTGYILLALSMLWILWIRIGWKGLTAMLIPIACLWYYISQINPMTPILRTPMLAVHVSIIIFSYILFLIITVLAIIGVSSSKQNEKMYEWSQQLLYPALFALAAGIFIGAVWANISWGRYWGWDAKETWALITFLVYSIPLHKKSFPVFQQPFKYHCFCIFAFLTILMTFLGVSFLLGGIHSYV